MGFGDASPIQTLASRICPRLYGLGNLLGGNRVKSRMASALQATYPREVRFLLPQPPFRMEVILIYRELSKWMIPGFLRHILAEKGLPACPSRGIPVCPLLCHPIK